MQQAGKRATNLLQPSDLASPGVQEFYQTVNQTARETFLGLAACPEIDWPKILSPSKIQLSNMVFEQAQSIVQSLWNLSCQPPYQAQFLDPIDEKTHHDSVLMAYDFHLDSTGQLKLIEINTNASGFLLVSLLEMVHFKKTIVNYTPLTALKTSFELALEKWGADPKQNVKSALTDEDWRGQRMLPEFYMYQEWFKSFGWDCEIAESKDFKFQNHELTLPGPSRPIQLVYNRTTDFHFEKEIHLALKNTYAAGAACITPTPKAYRLLADKQRMTEWSRPGALESWKLPETQVQAIQSALLRSYTQVDFESSDQIWSERKKYFFKPRRSHGGKSVYRGSSISKTVFERLMSEPSTIIQEHCPPSEVDGWKFDLRFFVFKDQIQLSVARMYRGQVTNFSSDLGGFTLVEFT